MAVDLIRSCIIISILAYSYFLNAEDSRSGPGYISEYITIPGKIGPDPDKTVYVNPRYEGTVKKVFFRSGDTVLKGSSLASIEQNNGVSLYNIVSPVSGTILHRDINPGEFIHPSQDAFRISDLNTVWVNFEVKPQFAGFFDKGKRITIHTQDHKKECSGSILYIAPIVDEKTRTVRVSVEIDNRNGYWAPGRLVDGHVFQKIVKISHVIDINFLKKEGEKFFSFLKEGHSVRKVPLRIGRMDNHFAEILSGIPVGSILSDHRDDDDHDSHKDAENDSDDGGHEH
ncbi:MAG: efflux RND transporter periplasmic adaptor subunit [Deltaproteobacteria bacterium]|nr:efflux RND transporter periplasmic adaptor subunit [Deltaproteobacteria bacterium]